MYSLGCIIYELFNLRKYFNDKEYNEINAIEPDIYNNKWKEIINLLLQTGYNKIINKNKVYNIILKEIYVNFIIGEI